MGRRILILQGHPDPAPERFGRALTAAYAEGARSAGHEIRAHDLGALDYPVLRRREDWEQGAAPAPLRPLQADLLWCQHLLLAYPLWLGDLPAHTKAALEHVLRPGLDGSATSTLHKPLKGRSAHVLITLGMPGFFYRWFYRAHSLKSLERNVLRFVGFGPVRHTLVGLVESPKSAAREAWLQRLHEAGAAGR